MKPITTLLSLLLLCWAAHAQKKISYPDLKMEYDLPAGWESTPYFKSNWETPAGSDACPCAVAMNVFKLAGKGTTDYIYVIAYPSDLKHIKTEKRQNIWYYGFTPVTKSENVKTEHMLWRQKISILKPLGSYPSQLKGYVAYQLYGEADPTYYMLYIIGKPAMLKEHKKEVDTIINSFKAIQ